MPTTSDRAFTVRHEGRRHTFKPGDDIPDDIAAQIEWLGRSKSTKNQLDKLTKAELLELAEANGLDIASSLSKSDIVADLNDAGVEPDGAD